MLTDNRSRLIGLSALLVTGGCQAPWSAPSTERLQVLADSMVLGRAPTQCTASGPRMWRAGWRQSCSCQYPLPDGSEVALLYDPWQRLAQLNRLWLGLSEARSVAIADSVIAAMTIQGARPLVGPLEQREAAVRSLRVQWAWCLDSATVWLTRDAQENNPNHMVAFLAGAVGRSKCGGPRR